MIPEKFKYKEDCKYIGLDMSKTHSQEETNKKIDEYNKRILREVGIRENIIEDFDCWKGNCFLKSNENNCNWGGWTTQEILEELLILSTAKNEYEKMEKIKNISRIINLNDRYEILKRQKWRCNICATRLKFDKNSRWEGEIAHIDHIFPYSKRKNYSNGEENINELSNLQALCPNCNLKKGGKFLQ